ncbi:MAG: molybdopterin dinucleotide binding domain-containing protein [Sulfuriferula sp.]
MTINNRRKVLAVGGLIAFGAGFSTTAKRMFSPLLSRDKSQSQYYGASLKPEFEVDPKTGTLKLNPAQQVSYTACLGCTTLCGVRVRIDRASGKVLRVAGNPYSPLSTDPHLPMKASIRDSFVALTRFQDKGLDGRSTACGRGNAVLEQMDSPFRVLRPMKRVGPRNSGQWEPIPFEQLIRELTEGGDLFGEGPVAGLKALRDLTTPIDPQRPELGPKVNQVALFTNFNDGRIAFGKRFIQHAYGSLNIVGHGSYCGGAWRSGSGALFGDMKKMPHGKPDFAQTEFALFIGTSPGQAGNPFKRSAAMVAKARTDGKLHYVVVDPVLTNSSNLAVGERAHWVPIKPGTDGALVMGMMRWLFENQRYDAKYLAHANLAIAEAAGEPSWSNATHLVISEPGHPRHGRFLRGSDMGLALAEEERYKENDPFVVLGADGHPVFHDKVTDAAQLWVDGTVEVGGQPLKVKSSLQLLREQAFARSLDEYAAACGIPVPTITGLAKEFSSHGKRAAAIAHGGMMAGNGFYNAYGVATLNALIGNLNWKGGLSMNGGGFKDAGPGPRYDLATFPGMIKPSGLPLGRNAPYEKTAEFATKKAAGKPYPAQAPWFPNAPALATEWLTGAVNGYPYSIKALFLWSANPLYGVPGLRAQMEKDLTDPKKIPLIVSIDPMINESNAFADYIVPDALLYESWGWGAAWGAVPTKASTARWPIVEPKAEKLADGQAIGVETFFIALAKAMALPGFGPGAIADMAGNTYPLERPEDWYLRGGANIAWQGKAPVGDASDEDILLSGVERLRPMLERTLKPEEVRKVAFILARGGRYQPAKETYSEDNPEWMTHRYNNGLQLYNETLGAAKDSITGKHFVGCPTWTEPVFSDGTAVRQHYPETEWPLQLVSFKSVLQNSYSIAASRLRGIHPENPVLMHPADAARFGLGNGDVAVIRTPGGSVRSRVVVYAGVMPGVLAIEHGFGHKELGARAHRIGGTRQPGDPAIGAGVSLNNLGLADPTRQGKSVWVDPVSGTAVRNGLPATVARA